MEILYMVAEAAGTILLSLALAGAVLLVGGMLLSAVCSVFGGGVALGGLAAFVPIVAAGGGILWMASRTGFGEGMRPSERHGG